MKLETLLTDLCKANGQQGGTIHQFMGRQDFADFEDAWADYRKCGIEFPTRKAFDKLARRYHITINWR